MTTISRPSIHRHMADDDCEAAAYATGRAGQPLRIARPINFERIPRLRQAWLLGRSDRRKGLALNAGMVVVYILIVIAVASFIHIPH